MVVSCNRNENEFYLVEFAGTSNWHLIDEIGSGLKKNYYIAVEAGHNIELT
jgi:hypothetical protein